MLHSCSSWSGAFTRFHQGANHHPFSSDLGTTGPNNRSRRDRPKPSRIPAHAWCHGPLVFAASCRPCVARAIVAAPAGTTHRPATGRFVTSRAPRRRGRRRTTTCSGPPAAQRRRPGRACGGCMVRGPGSARRDTTPMTAPL
jgi:hypothetical protein